MTIFTVQNSVGASGEKKQTNDVEKMSVNVNSNNDTTSRMWYIVVILLVALLSVSVANLVLSINHEEDHRHKPHRYEPSAAGKPSTGYGTKKNGVGAKSASMTKQISAFMWLNDDSEKTPFTFEDMFDPKYYPRGFSPSWVGETNKVSYISKQGDFVVFDLDTNTSSVIIERDILVKYRVSQLTFSPDELYVMIGYDIVTNVQTAYPQKYAIYDTTTKSVSEFPNDKDMQETRLLYAGFTSTGHSLSFTFKEDLYYQADVSSAPERLTTSGETHKKRNGDSYWNYAGVLWAFSAHWFSPDMKYLVYGEFDSQDIYTSEHPIYGHADRVYPYIFNQVYLKSGDAAHFSNASLIIMAFDTEERNTITIKPPKVFQNVDHYFYSVMWRDATHLAVEWCDRNQQHNIITICSAVDGSCRLTDDRTFKDGWILNPLLSVFIDDGEVALGVIPSEVGTEGDFKQVAMMATPLNDVGRVTYLTDAAREVYGIIGYDRHRHVVYYQGTGGNQLASHIFRVGTPAAESSLQPEVCLTCDVSDDCQYTSGRMSASTDYVVLTCRGPGVPKYYIKGIQNKDFSYTLEDNAQLTEALSHKDMPTREYRTIKVDATNEAEAEFILPPNMVTDGSVKYPMLLYPYGGPHGHTQADYQYKSNSPGSGGWENYLASSEGVIVVRINGRGTGGKGSRWLYALYRSLGTVEIQDQINGAAYIRDHYNYIDPDRIAVWGWSYGGFVTSHVMGDSSDVINCGLAVAPVTNFRYYYSGYTERYMDQDTEKDNQLGYDKTDATRKARNFRNKNFFLAHGSLDDNVHFQNAMQLIKALSEEQVLFTTQIYTDENHGIGSSNQYKHLFLSMTDFIKNKCFHL